MINARTQQPTNTYASLKCMLFGGYTPPEIPGRVHKFDDPPSKYEIAARTRKNRVMPSPKRDAMLKCFSNSEWQSIAQIAEKCGATHQYVQRNTLKLLNSGVVERRHIERPNCVSLYEYRFVAGGAV